MTTQIRWPNAIDAPRLLASLRVDTTLHWADPAGMRAEGRGSHSGVDLFSGPVPLAPHVHGAETESASDGHPDAWYTRGYELKGRGWAKEWHRYPNAQNAATLWYHDHALGMTRLSVYAGLAGAYLLRDADMEEALNLPEGDHDRELILQDRTLDENGQLLYPIDGVNPMIHPHWVPEFFGDVVVVNGKAWPFMTVEARRYRLRLVNGANARFFRLRFSDGRGFLQIGSDGGLLPDAVRLRTLVLAPGERADIVVDFGAVPPGRALELRNDAPAPYPAGQPVDPRTTGVVMQFRVVAARGVDAGRIPSRLTRMPDPERPLRTRVLTLTETEGPLGPLASLLDGKRWSDPVSENPLLGSTELWELVNLTADTHPIHLHLVQFRVLGRQRIGVEAIGESPPAPLDLRGALLGSPRPPAPNERGWKDTVQAPPREVTRILVRFAPQAGGDFPFDATAAPGYVWHCHILEHEDNEMMRPYRLSR